MDTLRKLLEENQVLQANEDKGRADEQILERYGLSKEDIKCDENAKNQDVQHAADAQNFFDISSSDSEAEEEVEQEEAQRLQQPPQPPPPPPQQQQQQDDEPLVGNFELREQDQDQQEKNGDFPEHVVLAKARNENEGHILRFTELFYPKTLNGIKPFMQQLKKRKHNKSMKLSIKYDSDEEVLFNQHQILVKSHREPPPLPPVELVEPQQQELQSGQSLMEDEQGPMDDKAKLSNKNTELQSEQLSDLETAIVRRTPLSLLDQIEWEKSIIWGDGNGGATDSGDDTLQEAEEVIPTMPTFGMYKEVLAKLIARQEKIKKQQQSNAVQTPLSSLSHAGALMRSPALSESVRGYAINQENRNRLIIAPTNRDSSVQTPAIMEISRSNPAAPVALSSPSLTNTPSTISSNNPGKHLPDFSTPKLLPPSQLSMTHLPPEPADMNTEADPEEEIKKKRKRYYRRKKDREKEAAEAVQAKPLEEIPQDGFIEENANSMIQTGTQKFNQGRNEEILRGDWVDMIIWDDCQKPKKAPLLEVILEENAETQDHMTSNTKQNEKIKKKLLAESRLLLSQQEVERTGVPSLYNVSNDDIYEEYFALLGLHRKEGKHIVRHSTPALRLDEEFFPTYIQREELKHLNRPIFCFRKGESIPVVYKIPEKERRKLKQKIIQQKRKLSMTDHRTVLIEYSEQRPPILNKMGMGNHIVNYYKKKIDESTIPKFDDGVTKIIESNEMLPILGKIHEGNSTTCLENSMFSSQLFPQQPTTTDFILTLQKTETGYQFSIREVQACYTSGHIQPQIEVPAPNSVPARNIMQNRLAWFIHRSFKDQLAIGIKRPKIRIQDVVKAFPEETQPTIRRCLTTCASFKRGGDANGTWLAKQEVIPSEEELQALVTPEMLCSIDSMFAGSQRLEERYITEHACIAAYASSFAKVSQRDKETIRYICQERKGTPWNKTANFLDFLARKEGSRLHLLEVAHENFTPEELEKLSSSADKAMDQSLDRPTTSNVLADNLSTKGMDETNREEKKRRGIKNKKVRDILRVVFAREAERLSKGISFVDQDPSTMGNLVRDLNPEDEENEDDMLDMIEREFENNKDMDQLDDQPEDEQEEILEAEKLLHRFYDEQDLQISDNEKDENEKPITPIQEAHKTSSRRGKKYEDQSKRYIVRKTVTVTQPDGTKAKRVEIIKDPWLVSLYKRKKENWEHTKLKKKHKSIPFLGGDEVDHFQAGPQDRRRLQDNFRRYKQEFLDRLRHGAPLDSINVKKKNARRKKQKRISNQDKHGTPSESPSNGAKGTSASADGSSSKLKKVVLNKEVIALAAKLSDKTASGSKSKRRKDDDDSNGDEDFVERIPLAKRRRQTTGQKINIILKEVLFYLKTQVFAEPFLAPVDVTIWRDYRKVVQTPMDLSCMERKVNNFEYLDATQFIADVRLIARNAEAYCRDKYPNVLLCANSLMQACLSEVEKVQPQLEEALKEPDRPVVQPKKSKKKEKRTTAVPVAVPEGEAEAVPIVESNGGDGEGGDTGNAVEMEPSFELIH